MATALQKQLAVIAADSTHQLDLKAQKQRHSKSLLFEPRDAASQSFDTIFQLCYEGFEELCMLDSRFAPFARNLFSEQSKDEDRTQMSAKENAELDEILHAFLGLVSGRLLLQPAMKAVEWLVRRFRTHEYNTEYMLLTFLPYHTAHIFPTLLSILPEQLPPSFRFLHPYVASLQTPPRHAVLSAAIGNQAFFSTFSQYVLGVAKARNQSAILLGFWASITAQAVNGMIDTTRSGRDSIRQQREEDLLLQVLPILQSAISTKGVQELFLGACMIMTILATKASLEDQVLDAMMEAVAGAWTEETTEEGLTCLAVLAEQKQELYQPWTVTKALLNMPDASGLMDRLSEVQRTSKLALMTALTLIERMVWRHDTGGIGLLGHITCGEMLERKHTVLVLGSLLAKMTALGPAEMSSEVYKNALNMLQELAADEGKLALLEEAAQSSSVNVQKMDLQLPSLMDVGKDTEMEDVSDAPALRNSEDSRHAEFNKLWEQLPALQHMSFWAQEADERFALYLQAFQVATSSSKDMDRIVQSVQFSTSGREERPTLLTFLARVWCTASGSLAKLKALSLSTTTVESMQEDKDFDLQALLPYALAGLADSSRRVRKGAAELCIAMQRAYGNNRGKSANVWIQSFAYGDDTSIHWLSSRESYTLLEHAVVPILEDCIMDAGNVSRSLANTLNTDSKQLKKSSRQDAAYYLASHANATSTFRVRLLLLDVLNNVGKIASEARNKSLIPMVHAWARLPSKMVESGCMQQSVDKVQMEKATVASLTHRSTDEIKALQGLAAGPLSNRQELSALAFARIKRIWPSVSDDMRIKLVDFLLENAFDSNGASPDIEASALHTLRNVELSTDALIHLVGDLPKASDLQDQPPSAKKRRTSGPQNTGSRPVDQSRVRDAIRRITVVLELVEGSKPDRHQRLLKSLFHLLSELHHYRNLTGSELVYLQGVLLGCLSSVVEGMKQAAEKDIDRSAIRTDLIVDCVRTTSSTQIHNAALLLMSSLAGWAPELVLHSVMPLFTFMSSTLLRQHDEFSAHVTDQTVARIVPPLAASLKKKGKDLVTGAAELLLSFTAAFEHIPLHRRLGLFQHLVGTLGAEETLFAVIAMLTERYPNDSAVPNFVAELANHFETTAALTAATQYLDLMFDATKPKRKLADTLLGFSDKSDEQREESLDALLEGLAGLLADRNLRERLAHKPSDGPHADKISATYSILLEKTMELNRDLSSKTYSATAAEHVLTSVLGLMPTGDFIDSSAQLMQTGSDETRQQVFRSLEARVAQAKRGDADAKEVFLGVLPNCAVFIDPSQPVSTRYAAISCIDQVCEKYGKKDREAVLAAVENIIGAAALGSDDHSLRVISILCLTSMVEVLGEEAVGLLPNVLSRTLELMRQAFDSNDGGEDLLKASFGLLSAVLDELSWMLSSHYLEDALKLTATATRNDSKIVAQRFSTLVTMKVVPQEVFTAVNRTWDYVLAAGADVVHSHVEILRQVIQHQSKATITKNAPTLFPVMLRAFDLRRELGYSTDNDQSSTAVCELVDRVALDMTLKLNDATFRPFFIRLVEWSSALPKKDADGLILRAMSLFSFTLTLFDQLKSIVTSYASFILEQAVIVLERDNSSHPNARMLLDLVLQTLASSFTHDQDDFWQAPAHFDAIAAPLISQLSKARTLQATAHVIPAISELAAAASSPENLKSMNTQIMSFMRHESAAVRLAAVKCERNITEKCNFDWLALLPEMLPFISELQEDDDEGVEGETLRWVRQIEEVTGESLEGMLA